MRIALAGQGGAPGNTHFGYADTFHIFDIDADPPMLLEIRANTPHCGDDGGDRSRLVRSADLLLDCDAVLASAIGPCAREALSARDVIPIEHDGRGFDGANGVIQAIRTHLDRTRRSRAGRHANPQEAAR